MDHRRKIYELTKQLRAVTDQKYEQELKGRDKIPAEALNRVPDDRDVELAKSQKKLKHVEEALRVKTTQWQELHTKFEQYQQESTRRLEAEQESIRLYQAQVRKLQDQLMAERTVTRADREKITQLEIQLTGRPAPEYTPDVRRHHLMQEIKQAAGIYGEDSPQYKNLAKKLDRLLTAEAAYAAKCATDNTPHITSVEP